MVSFHRYINKIMEVTGLQRFAVNLSPFASVRGSDSFSHFYQIKLLNEDKLIKLIHCLKTNKTIIFKLLHHTSMSKLCSRPEPI